MRIVSSLLPTVVSWNAPTKSTELTPLVLAINVDAKVHSTTDRNEHVPFHNNDGVLSISTPVSGSTMRDVVELVAHRVSNAGVGLNNTGSSIIEII